MEAKAKILGRGTDEVVLVGCLPVVTQAHCGNPVLGPEDSMRGRTGTESPAVAELMFYQRRELSSKRHRKKDFACAIFDT